MLYFSLQILKVAVFICGINLADSEASPTLTDFHVLVVDVAIELNFG